MPDDARNPFTRGRLRGRTRHPSERSLDPPAALSVEAFDDPSAALMALLTLYVNDEHAQFNELLFQIATTPAPVQGGTHKSSLLPQVTQLVFAVLNGFIGALAESADIPPAQIVQDLALEFLNAAEEIGEQ